MNGGIKLSYLVALMAWLGTLGSLWVMVVRIVPVDYFNLGAFIFYLVVALLASLTYSGPKGRTP